MIRIILAINNLCLTWLLIRTASDKEHNYETDNPEDSLERKLHYAKANVEQCLHRTINLYVKLIDDRAHNNRNTEKDIRHMSRTVWSSFDSAKVWIILIQTTFLRVFCSCSSNEWSRWRKEARVSERKRRDCGFVYGGDIRSHEYKRMGTPLPSVAAASNSRIAEQKARMSSNLIVKGGRLPRHPDDTYHFLNLEQVF